MTASRVAIEGTKQLARDNVAAAHIDRDTDEADIHAWFEDEGHAAYGNELAGRGFQSDELYAVYMGELELIRLELTRPEGV